MSLACGTFIIGIKLWIIFGLDIGLGLKSSGLGLEGPGLGLGLGGSRPWTWPQESRPWPWPRPWGSWPWLRPWPLEFTLDDYNTDTSFVTKLSFAKPPILYTFSETRILELSIGQTVWPQFTNGRAYIIGIAYRPVDARRVSVVPKTPKWYRLRNLQGCALGRGRFGLRTSRDVARSCLGLVSEKFSNVSVSSRVSTYRSRHHLFVCLFVYYLHWTNVDKSRNGCRSFGFFWQIVPNINAAHTKKVRSNRRNS